MDNDNLLNSDTNLPNFSNPRVLAGFLDLVGSSLTTVLNRVGRTGTMTVDDANDLVATHRMLYSIRQGIGYDNDFGMQNQMDVVEEVTAEIARVQAERDPNEFRSRIDRFRANAKAIGLPNDEVEKYLSSILPTESVADAADRILRDL